MLKQSLCDKPLDTPDLFDAYVRQAKCFLQRGMLNEAKDVCRYLHNNELFLDEDDFYAIEVWGMTLYRKGEYSEARRILDSALRKEKNPVRIRTLRAIEEKILRKVNISIAYSGQSHSEAAKGLDEFKQAFERRKNTITRKKRRHKRPKARNFQPRVLIEQTHDEDIVSEPPEIKEELASSEESLSELDDTMSIASMDNSESDITEQLEQYWIEEETRWKEENTGIYSHHSSESKEFLVETEDENMEDDVDGSENELKKGTETYFDLSRLYHTKTISKERSFQNIQFLSEGIHIDPGLLQQFDRHSKRKCIYDQVFDTHILQTMLENDPDKYIHCVINLTSSHEAKCFPITRHAHIDAIEISGRSRIGQTFHEDEVLVEILFQHVQLKKVSGKVVGVIKRSRNSDIQHPVFLCSPDEIEHNFVHPLCKTISKICVIDKEIWKEYEGDPAGRHKIEVYHYNEEDGSFEDPIIEEIHPSERNSCLLLVAYIDWPSNCTYPKGVIIDVIRGVQSLSKGLDVLEMKYTVPSLFDKDTVDAVNGMDIEDGNIEYIEDDRIDIQGLNVFTIDPPGAKDLDDAMSLERTAEGFRVGVHIADVSSVVRKGSHLDVEAQRRATTFYPPSPRRPRHMLPEPLSTDMCSLLENKNRRAISVFFRISENGTLIKTENSNEIEIKRTMVRSRKQFTYKEVQIIIESADSDTNDDIARDVKLLSNLSKIIRFERLGNAMFALNVQQSFEGCLDAHYLVEEFMIMTNEAVAKTLLKESAMFPMRCQHAPSKERIEEFEDKHKFTLDVVLKLQGRQIGQTCPDFTTCSHSEGAVIVTENTWNSISKRNNVDLICCDEMHPLQSVIRQDWISLQDRAEYVCSSFVSEKANGEHYDLNIFPYTHFTSPLRRYADLLVHRVLTATLFSNQQEMYQEEEIETICIHINSRMKKEKEYETECKALLLACELKREPKMFNCTISGVSDTDISLLVPKLTNGRGRTFEMKFRQMDMMRKPQQCTITPLGGTFDGVELAWQKRIYNMNMAGPAVVSKDTIELYPYRDIYFIPMRKWVNILNSKIDERQNDLRQQLSELRFNGNRSQCMDVTTEHKDPLKMLPNTKFSKVFFKGQNVQVQFTAEAYKGVLSPTPMLYEMTRNVKLCLNHTKDPVLFLSQYVTTPPVDGYDRIIDYIRTWLPILRMESATGAVRNEDSCYVKDVPVNFETHRKGVLSLCNRKCKDRHIVFSGERKESDEPSSRELPPSYDWLCLRKVESQASNYSKSFIAETLNNSRVWVEHAEVIAVMTDQNKELCNMCSRQNIHTATEEVCGEIHVCFQLNSGSARSWDTWDTIDVELLKKSEVDRRTESYMKLMSREMPDSLSALIALNKPMPDIDEEHIRSANEMEIRDLTYEYSRGSTQEFRPLPPNNEKQQEAIDKALKSAFSLIQGPPGTGKTYTGIKLLYLFDKINEMVKDERNPRRQILFCGPSNKAIDVVANWLLQRVPEEFRPSFVRVYSQAIETRDFPIPRRSQITRGTRNQNAPSALRRVALHHIIREDGKPFADEIKETEKRFQNKKYTPSNKEVDEYLQLILKASIVEIRQYSIILCTTVVASNYKILKETAVYQVIIDEAGMCPEPQCLIPIIATNAKQVVLIGDHKQLRPIITCKEAGELGLSKSLFERYAVTNRSEGVEFTMLDTQYRMNPAICDFPSQEFYDGELNTEAGAWSHKTFDAIWPRDEYDQVLPHVLIHVEGEEKVLTVSTEEGNEQSRSNEAEIYEVMKVFKYLTDQQLGSVKVLSQYNAQCSELRRLMKENYINFNDENICTVVSSQGGEWDYVIFSTVRSLKDYAIETSPTRGWCMKHLGFITDRNQINVALTRARKGLIIVGNKKLLRCDKTWSSLLRDYEKNGCVKQPGEFPPRGQTRSRQEIMQRNIRQSERRFGNRPYEAPPAATFYTGSFD
ncbi:helicase with zinc finger domain 2-like isoform X2 [Mya arenaria]|nr:helicase with zinc finger domain 2-like isoform X2 [Mya arenaria]